MKNAFIKKMFSNKKLLRSLFSLLIFSLSLTFSSFFFTSLSTGYNHSIYSALKPSLAKKESTHIALQKKYDFAGMNTYNQPPSYGSYLYKTSLTENRKVITPFVIKNSTHAGNFCIDSSSYTNYISIVETIYTECFSNVFYREQEDTSIPFDCVIIPESYAKHLVETGVYSNYDEIIDSNCKIKIVQKTQFSQEVEVEYTVSNIFISRGIGWALRSIVMYEPFFINIDSSLFKGYGFLGSIIRKENVSHLMKMIAEMDELDNRISPFTEYGKTYHYFEIHDNDLSDEINASVNANLKKYGYVYSNNLFVYNLIFGIALLMVIAAVFIDSFKNYDIPFKYRFVMFIFSLILFSFFSYFGVGVTIGGYNIPINYFPVLLFEIIVACLSITTSFIIWKKKND